MPSQNIQNTNIIYPSLFSSTYRQMFNNENSIVLLFFLTQIPSATRSGFPVAITTFLAYELLFPNIFTYSKDQSPSWETNRFSVKKFPSFYGTRRFITAFTSARHLSLSLATSIQSMTPSHFLKIHINPYRTNVENRVSS